MVSQFPFGSDFVLLRDAMNQLLQDSFVPSGGSRYGTSSGTRAAMRPLPLDVFATPDEAVVIAAVPGMSPQDLEITYNQNTLTLVGLDARPPPRASRARTRPGTCVSCGMVRFQRTVTLPFEVDASQAEANFEHGIVASHCRRPSGPSRRRSRSRR
jgi:HSP20 family protein